MKTKYLNFKSIKLKLILIFIFLLMLYWLKNQFSIEFFKDFSLSEYFPFSLLKNEYTVIEHDKSGVLIDETFDSFLDKVNWGILWAGQEDSVGIDFESTDSAKYITIINDGSANWAISSISLIETDIGDSIKISAIVKKTDPHIKTGISIATFDQNKNIIDWNTNQKYLEKAGEWVLLNKTFTIPRGIYFIRLRLVGNGHGKVAFDSVKLIREKVY